MRHGFYLATVGLAVLAAGCQGSSNTGDGVQCGAGTHLMDSQCVPDTGVTCGTGTHQVDGQCVPVASPLTCGTDTHEVNGQCVPSNALACGAGTREVDGECLPDSSLVCGAGTREVAGQCVPVSSAPPCGQGTVASDGGCVVAPAATITSARLTYLEVRYDLSKPSFLNNALPIKFGITSHSASDSAPVTTAVNVMFSFVEPVPADPANPKTCDSSGFNLKLVGDGTEQRFAGDIVLTDECADLVGTGATVNLAVDFDKALKASTPTGIDYPAVTFTAAAASGADNQRCRKTPLPSAANPGLGCVHDIQAQPSPTGADGKALVDISLESLVPDSSVAVVWPAGQDPDVPPGTPASERESTKPSLVVQAGFTLEGRNPYRRKVTISPELAAQDPALAEAARAGLTDAELDALDDLPGTGATIRYDMRATEALTTEGWLPLAIDDPSNPNPDGHVPEIALSAIAPGAEVSFAHALYIEGDLLTAVSAGGTWAARDVFTVRGCLVAGFPEGGNQGDEDSEESDNVPSGSCKTFRARLVRAAPPASMAGAHTFDQTWGTSVGSADRAQLSGSLRTNNSLSLTGATTDNEGLVELSGNIGSAFNVRLFRAYGKAGALVTLASSYIDLGIDAFGVNLWGYQNSTSDQTYSSPIMYAKTFQFPVLAYGFGPVSVGITFGIGGNVGLTPNFTIKAAEGPDATVTELAMATSNGTLSASLRPEVGLSANVTGGIDVWVASAKVVATVQLINLGLPLVASLRWGVTALDGTAARQITVLADVTWDLTLEWLNLTVDLVGKIGFWSRTINVFTYTNPAQTVNLLKRALPSPLVLE